LNGRAAQPTNAEYGHSLAWFEPRLVQGVQRGRRRAHQDGAMSERDFFRQTKEASSRHNQKLGIATVAVLAHHGALKTELLEFALAVDAVATARQVMHTNAITAPEVTHLAARLLNNPSHFMA
jgi:hypothetical protein